MHTNNVNHIAQDNVAVLLFWRHKIVTPEGKTRRKKDNLTTNERQDTLACPLSLTRDSTPPCRCKPQVNRRTHIDCAQVGGMRITYPPTQRCPCSAQPQSQLTLRKVNFPPTDRKAIAQALQSGPPSSLWPTYWKAVKCVSSCFCSEQAKVPVRLDDDGLLTERLQGSVGGREEVCYIADGPS